MSIGDILNFFPQLKIRWILILNSPITTLRYWDVKNFNQNMSLRCYGYFLGKLKLMKDTHHDEVFVEETGLVVMRNNHWFYDYMELVAIANEILGEDDP